MAKEEEPKENEKAQKEKDKEQPAKPKQQPKTGSIVRIAGRDIDGELEIPAALMQIKGIGYNLSNALSIALRDIYKIPKESQIGKLNEADVAKLEGLLKDPKKANMPLYLFNRRNDRETGTDMHLVGTDLMVKTRQDIENDIKIQSWRGFRHRYGQKVRGQRTRSTGRTGATVGVTKKAAEAAQKAAQAQEGKTAGAEAKK